MPNRFRTVIGSALAAGVALSITAAPVATADPLRDFQGSVENIAAGIQIPHFEAPRIDTASLEGLAPNPNSVPGIPGGPTGPGAYVPTAQQRDQIENELRARINDYRASQGRHRPGWDGGLNNSSRWWADQVANHGKTGHSPQNTRPNSGENVWYGGNTPWNRVAVDAVNSWRNSAGHNRNMLDTRTKAHGVGVAWSHQDQRWIAVYQFRVY